MGLEVPSCLSCLMCSALMGGMDAWVDASDAGSDGAAAAGISTAAGLSVACHMAASIDDQQGHACRVTCAMQLRNRLVSVLPVPADVESSACPAFEWLLNCIRPHRHIQDGMSSEALVSRWEGSSPENILQAYWKLAACQFRNLGCAAVRVQGQIAARPHAL